MNSQPMVEAKKEFDVILHDFEMYLNESKDISDGLYSKARTLHDFQLNVDNEVSGDTPKSPEGYLSALQEVLRRIHYLNRRNAEILKHLNTLI